MVGGESYFNILSEYVPSQFYPGINQLCDSNSISYTPELHYYLGAYLRYCRDFYNLDLMPYYNCVTGEYTDTIRIVDDTVKKVSSTNDGYKVLKVDVCFDREYSIYIDCASQVRLGIAYEYNDTVDTSIMDVITLSNCSFTKPYVYSGYKRTEFNKNLDEKYLTMYIQVPSSVPSNIVVLEGDYSGTYSIMDSYTLKVNRVYYGENDQHFNDSEVANYCKVLPRLVTQYTSKLNAFDNKLVEYLTLNVIDNSDKIYENITRVQGYVSSSRNELENRSRYRKSFTKGVWDNNLRMYLYNLALTNPITPLNINVDGYVDRNLETIVTRGQNV